MRFAMQSTRPGDTVPSWSDIAELLDEIRSPQRDEVEEAVRGACGDELAPPTVARITDSVLALYRCRRRGE